MLAATPTKQQHWWALAFLPYWGSQVRRGGRSPWQGAPSSEVPGHTLYHLLYVTLSTLHTEQHRSIITAAAAVVQVSALALTPGRLGPLVASSCSNSEQYLQGARKTAKFAASKFWTADHCLTPRTAPRSINACKLLCDRAMMEDEVARFGILAGRSGPLQLLLLTLLLQHPQAACRAGRCQEAAG